MVSLTPQEEEIALRAVEDPKIQQAVKTNKGIDRIKEVRLLLRKHFPEVRSLPDHETGGAIIGTVSAEFLIGKMVVDLLK